MSSSAFSFEDFDSMLDSAAASTVLPSSSSSRPPSLRALSSSASSSPSGESTAFAVVGVSLLGDTGGVQGGQGVSNPSGSAASKRLSLLVNPSVSMLCMGLMTSAKFCTRVLAEGATGCGATSHARKFLSPAESAFVKDTEVRAYCSPVFDLSIMSPAQRTWIQGVQMTVPEWIQLFKQVKEGHTPKWLSFDDSPAVTANTLSVSTELEILSPAQAELGGIMTVIPMLSFDDSISGVDDDEVELSAVDVSSYIRKFRSHFSKLRDKWSKAFTEVEAGYGVIVQDLQKLQLMSRGQAKLLGQPVPLDGGTPPSLWGGLQHVNDSITMVASEVQAQAQSLSTLAVDQTHLTHSVLELEAQVDGSSDLANAVTALTSDLRALENRFLRLVPMLNNIKRGTSSPAPGVGGDQASLLATRMEACEQSVETFQKVLEDLQARPSEPMVVVSALDSRIREVQMQMKQLQLKVVGKGVKIANKTFQSFDEVKTWVDINLPNHRYGLFVDGVSIFEFFTSGHIDAETTYSSFYSQHRTGFKSSFEARVASSVQNLFPSVFGKSDSNVDTAEALPALSSPAKWDSNDGNTGLRYQIMRNMADVELQIQETITTVLGDYLEAQHIARECLHQSKRFALELCQFITLDFQKWKHRGHSPKDAWKMTAVCVRRIFEELYSERVVARDVYDQGNPSFTTSKYLWATWKAHAVMNKYLRHQFYEHPSISAVLARHLADNYVKPDDSQGSKIKALEAMIRQLESNHKTLQSKYDTLRVARDQEKEKQKEILKAKNWKGPPAVGSG